MEAPQQSGELVNHIQGKGDPKRKHTFALFTRTSSGTPDSFRTLSTTSRRICVISKRVPRHEASKICTGANKIKQGTYIRHRQEKLYLACQVNFKRPQLLFRQLTRLQLVHVFHDTMDTHGKTPHLCSPKVVTSEPPHNERQMSGSRLSPWNLVLSSATRTLVFQETSAIS